jgi:hypothetical protein
MNELYLGLIALLATAAPVLLGSYAISPRQVGVIAVNERKHQSRSRIFNIDKTQDTTAIEAIAMGVHQTRRLNIRDERFYGFDSPPGRFFSRSVEWPGPRSSE